MSLFRVLFCVGLIATPTTSVAQLTAGDVSALYGRLLAAEQVDIGSRSTRESRIAFLDRVVGIAFWGHPTHNPAPDPRWCLRSGGAGRPLSDDVIALCTARDAWDLVSGIGGPNPTLQLEYLGVLPSIQLLFVPSFPESGAAGPTLDPAVVSGRRLSLSWRPAPGTSTAEYVVTASTVPGGMPVAYAPLGSATSLAVEVPDGPYYLRVAARVNGVFLRSNEVFAYVGPGSVPGAPTSPAVSLTGEIATLSWGAPAGGSHPVTGYDVEAGLAPGAIALTIPRGTVTAFVTPPIPAGSYFLRVRARNAVGVGPASADVHLAVGVSPPSAPVLASTGSGSAVALSWLAPTSGAAVSAYRLLAGTRPGAQDIAALDLPAGTLAFAAGGVPPGTYYVRVVAASAVGFGAVSNEVTVVVP